MDLINYTDLPDRCAARLTSFTHRGTYVVYRECTRDLGHEGRCDFGPWKRDGKVIGEKKEDR